MSSTRIVISRSYITPDRELDALSRIYERGIARYEEKKAGALNAGDDDVRKDQDAHTDVTIVPGCLDESTAGSLPVED